MNASLTATLAFTAILHTAGIPGGSDIVPLTAEQIGENLLRGSAPSDFEDFRFDRFGVLKTSVMAWRIPNTGRVLILYGTENREVFELVDQMPSRKTAKVWHAKAEQLAI